MKIKGKGTDLTTAQDAVVLQRQNEFAGQANAYGRKAKQILGEDSVDVAVGLGSLINRELDPAVMGNERRQRVEELKRLVAAGEYKPDSMAVAAALSQEISLAILTEGGAPSGDSGDDEEGSRF